MSYNQRRTSRPSSAASHSSRTSHVSEKEIKLECKAVFLGRYDDIREEIESKDDLINLLQQTGRNVSNKGIQKYWTRNTEFLTYDDFVDVCKREPVTSEDDLIRAFRKIDINEDGYISLDELFKIMTSKGEKMSRSEVKALIDEVDENKDGKLDYEEFSKMIVSSTEDFKKISIKVMEKKEKKKRKPDGENGSTTPRKDKDGASLGSQLSITSSVSEKRHRRSRHNSSSSRKHYDNASTEGSEEMSSDPSNITLSLPASGQQWKGSRQSLNSVSAEDSRLSNHRESRPKSSGKGGRLQEPGNLNEWTSVASKGTIFLDEEHGFISHVFNLNLTEDTDIWITIKPLKIGESGESLDGTIIDTALLVLNEDDNSLIAFTENKDSKGRYSLRCNLSMGNYTLIPFTTGCRLKPRKNMPVKEAKLVTKDRDGKIVITRAFRKALQEIFEMADLDSNGFMSRQEFNWYNRQTSGEDVADDEWQVVKDNVELQRGEIPCAGFIKLNEMEADDNLGDTGDLWITLSVMGFNKSLILDEACPFMLKIFTRDCTDPDLVVSGLEPCRDKINDAMCDFVTLKGTPCKVRGMKDLVMYQFLNDHRGVVVVENRSKTKVDMELDCSRSRGVVSHTGSLISTVKVPAQSSVVGHYIMPLDDRGDFNFNCEERILK